MKSSGADLSRTARPRPADDVLGEIGDQPRPAHADKHEADGAGDQAIAGGVPETDMALAQHERERDRRAGRNQHPVRPADIGDGAEEFARLRRQRPRPLEHERIDQQKSEQDQRQREHHLLDDGEVLQAQSMASRLASIGTFEAPGRGYAALTELGSRLPSQMK